jgi:ribosome-associated translation inhibitor RaiA
MKETEIALIGFKDIDESEVSVIKGIVLKSLNKLTKKAEIELVRIELKEHKHAKEFMHEVKAVLFLKNSLISATDTDKNLYKAIQGVLCKLDKESEHKRKDN